LYNFHLLDNHTKEKLDTNIVTVQANIEDDQSSTGDETTTTNETEKSGMLSQNPSQSNMTQFYIYY
jgi:hypothetical protein